MRERYYSLDLIKIVMTICIIFHHYQQVSGVMFSGFNFYGGGFVFGYLVEFFFMISGFLTIYSTDVHQKRGKFLSFIKKCSRLYVCSSVACMALLVINGLYIYCYGQGVFGKKYYVQNILTSLLLVHQGWVIDVLPAVNNPTWYLCVLILCYILYYGIKYFTDKYFLISESYIYLMIIIISVIGKKIEITLPFFRASNQRGYTAFFVGVLLYKIIKIFKKKELQILKLFLFLMALILIFLKGYSNWYVLTLLAWPFVFLIVLDTKQIQNKIFSYWGGII